MDGPEPRTRRSFLGLLGVGLGGLGFIAGASALSGGNASGEDHVSLVSSADPIIVS